MKFLEDGVRIRVAEAYETMIPREGTCDRIEPDYLYSMLQPGSFGHMLRDTFLIMHVNLAQLGLENVEHNLLVVRSVLCNDIKTFYEYGVVMIRRYTQWVASTSDTFEHAVSTCGRGKHILFRSVVVSSILNYNEPEYGTRQPVILSFEGALSGSFRGLRDTAYKRNGIPLLPHALQHSSLKVLFHEKLIADSRRIVNTLDLVSSLRARFPQMIIDSKALSALSARQQLEELSSTSIFITPHGSTSLRSLFLPDGAQMIVIGPDEAPGLRYGAWCEYFQFFMHITHFQYHCYHCTDPKESEPKASYVGPENMHNFDYILWWSSDKRLIADKLGDFVDVAFASIKHNAAQTTANITFVPFEHRARQCFREGLPIAL